MVPKEYKDGKMNGSADGDRKETSKIISFMGDESNLRMVRLSINSIATVS